MRFTHPQHPARAVRLAMGMNLFAAETADELLAGLRAVCVPLRERMAPGRSFGVGMYAPGRLAAELVRGPASGRDRLRGFLAEHGLEAFTWNAFPYGGFQTDGLKRRVFEPTWIEPERAAFTRDVAALAVEMGGAARAGEHLSISTHTGLFGDGGGAAAGAACARRQVEAALDLARLEDESGARCVLSLEAEPRSNCNDTAELERFRGRQLRPGARGPGAASALARHVGTCLDACHAAVEFEPAESALANATAHGAPLGKLQWSSALALLRPADASARARLLALDEPRFLHQVTGRRPDGSFARADDLADLPDAAAFPRDPAWGACEELRCHFHVPIDREALDGGLATTRASADELVRAALADPTRWGTTELHLEVETYTWDVLPPDVRPGPPGGPDPNGAGPLVDALERELRHALAVLMDAGWQSA